MPAPTLNVSASAPPRWNLVTRLATILLLAFVIGWILNRVGQQLSRSQHPAGFVRGLVQGAYVIPAFGRYDLAAQVVTRVRELVG